MIPIPYFGLLCFAKHPSYPINPIITKGPVHADFRCVA